MKERDFIVHLTYGVTVLFCNNTAVIIGGDGIKDTLKLFICNFHISYISPINYFLDAESLNFNYASSYIPRWQLAIRIYTQVAMLKQWMMVNNYDVNDDNKHDTQEIAVECLIMTGFVRRLLVFFFHVFVVLYLFLQINNIFCLELIIYHCEISSEALKHT